MRKVFSLLRIWEKTLLIAFTILIAGSLYWNWQIFFLHHTVPTPGSGGNINEGIIGQPHLLNPILAVSSTDQTLVHALFSGLYRYDEDGQLIPDLAVSLPSIGADGKHYTVKLQPNLSWHDGKPVTADDILFTVSEIQNNTVQSPLRTLWLATSVQKIDALTVVFATKDTSGPFVHNLTLPLLPEHVWKNIPAENFSSNALNMKPLGNGPFAIKQIENNPDGTVKRMVLASFANYPRKPHLDTLTIVFYPNADGLRQGYIAKEFQNFGIATNDNLDIPENTSTTQLHIALPQYQALFLNTANPKLADVAVRQALRLAIDSAHVTETAWPTKADSIYNPPLGLRTSSEAIPKGDVEAAEILLDKAGWTKKANGIRSKGKISLDLHIVTSDAPSFINAGQLIANTLQSIGVGATITSVQINDLNRDFVRPRQYDALLFSERVGADPDPFAFWHSSQVKDPGLNVSNFTSSEVDALITNARTTTSTKERQDLYAKLQDILKTAVPAIYLNQSNYTYIIDNSLQGVIMSNLPDPTWRLSFSPEWYVRTARAWKN